MNDSFHTRKSALLALSTFALAAGLAFTGQAAAQDTAGAIQGQAQPGDVVLIESGDTSFSREIVVKDNGRYKAGNLQAGAYTVTVRHADGTTALKRVVHLQVGKTIRVQ